MLEDADDISVDLAKRVLAATHQEGPGSRTLYSNVYDLKRRIVYLYHYHNFQNEVVIDLKSIYLICFQKHLLPRISKIPAKDLK